MDDLIRRSDVIKAIREFDSEYPMGLLDYEKLINDIPPAQQWIPCSERLPEKPIGYPNCQIRRTYFLVSLESGCVETLGYEFDRDEWQITGSPVIAWMPLPEPCTEEQT